MNKVGFGFLRLPKKGEELDYEQINEMVDLFLSRGGSYFDTCYTYLNGDSEKGLKKCLVDRYPRERFRIANKLPGYRCKTYEDCRTYFDEGLRRCGVSYFDVYMLHWLNQKHYDIAEQVDEFRFLREVKASGEAREIGFSYHDSASLLDRILTDHPEVDVVQIQLNYLDWDSAGIEAGKCYDVCVKHGKKVCVMEPVKGGTLSTLPAEAERLLREMHPDWSNASWALRFVQSLEQVGICLSGMSTPDQVRENMADISPLGETERERLRAVCDIITAQTAVPCTGCRYCETHCPRKIAIPDYFRMYNELSRHPRDEWKIKPVYEQLIRQRGKASDCIACRSCETHCPQKIEISAFMKKAAEALG